MSYTLTASCEQCVKAKQCSDRHFIAGAIYGIHMTSIEEGHKGSGQIELHCNNLVQRVTAEGEGK